MNLIIKISTTFYDKICNVVNQLYFEFKNTSNHKQYFVISFCLLLCSCFVFVVGCDSLNDVNHFIQYWIDYLDKDGLFRVYNHLNDESHFVNYPPLYLVYLYLIKGLLLFLKSNFGAKGIVVCLQLQNIIIHTILSFIVKKKIGNKAFFLWFFNPLFLYISLLTIHFDELFAFLMICCVIAMKNNKDVLSYILFGICCLLKLQGGYLLPLILWHIFSDKNKFFGRMTKCIIVGACCLSIFLPFMLTTGDWLLPINLYVGTNSFNSNYFASFLPTNLLGLVSEILIADYGVTKSPAFSLHLMFVAQLTNLLLLVLSIVYLYKLLDKRKINIIEASCAYLFCIYYTNWSQAQRYSAYFIAFAIVLSAIYNDKYESFSSGITILECFAMLFVEILNRCLMISGFNVVTYALFIVYIIFWLMFMYIFIQYQKYIFKRNVPEIE